MNHASTAIKLLISLLLLWLALQAGKMGYANLHFYNANNHLESWINEGEISSEASYRQALAAIKISNDYHPDNPQYLETLAAIQEWAVYGGYAEDSNFDLALANYDRAIQLRPFWPWTWGAKVMTKWRLGQIDDEFWQSLQMLDKYGPYTKDANLLIVDAGLMLMLSDSEYAEQAKLLVVKHYQRGMANSRAVKPMQEIIKLHEAEDLIAELVAL